jgi:SAM-dependent methyltransferase
MSLVIIMRERIENTMKYLLIFLVFFINLNAQDPTEELFTNIYEQGVWGGVDYSGGGAEFKNSQKYIAFLQKFLRKKKIQTVVDVGCGDWQISKYIDWHSIQYLGCDVVAHLVDKNQQRFGSPSVQFIHANAMEIDLPEADLLICKDVLQHLPHAEIKKFLMQLPKFKHCLITNDVDPATMSSDNVDIAKDSYPPYRTLDLTKPPFNQKGVKILTYQSDMFLKQVLHIKYDK